MAGNPYDGRSMAALLAEGERLRSLPANRNTRRGSIYLYTPATHRKLDQIAWAITHLTAAQRASEETP